MTAIERLSRAALTGIIDDALFVFALEIESAGEFDHVNKIHTGCGKINAAYELTKAIQLQRPKLVINLGSAGSHLFKRGEVVCCTRFLQRDMDAKELGFKDFETPFSRMDPMLNYGYQLKGLPEGICGTGDSFESNHRSPAYNVIEMEAFALAYVAMKEKIPFLCLKYISDGADGAAAKEWKVQVHHAADAFKKILVPVT